MYSKIAGSENAGLVLEMKDHIAWLDNSRTKNDGREYAEQASENLT